MSTFLLGTLTLAIWIGVVLLIWVRRRRSPERPSSSVRKYRKARKRMARSNDDLTPLWRGAGAAGSLSALENVNTDQHGPSESSPVQLAGEPVVFESTRRLPSEVLPDQTLDLTKFEPPAIEVSSFEPPSAETQPAAKDEFTELEEVLDSITAESPEVRDLPPAKKTAAARRGVRKIGRLTYVLVDEQGRPQFEE